SVQGARSARVPLRSLTLSASRLIRDEAASIGGSYTLSFRVPETVSPEALMRSSPPRTTCSTYLVAWIRLMLASRLRNSCQVGGCCGVAVACISWKTGSRTIGGACSKTQLITEPRLEVQRFLR